MAKRQFYEAKSRFSKSVICAARTGFDDIDRIEPSLDSLVPDNPNKPYGIKELILKTVGRFLRLPKTFARNIVIGFGRVAGHTVGCVANQPMVWPACSTAAPAARRRGSCASATPSTSRS